MNILFNLVILFNIYCLVYKQIHRGLNHTPHRTNYRRLMSESNQETTVKSTVKFMTVFRFASN